MHLCFVSMTNDNTHHYRMQPLYGKKIITKFMLFLFKTDRALWSKTIHMHKCDAYQLRSAGVCQSMSVPQALNPVGSDRNPKAYSGCHLLSTD